MFRPCEDMGHPMWQAHFSTHGENSHAIEYLCDEEMTEHSLEAMDEEQWEYEPDAGGAWKGMTTEEHMDFAQQLSHHGHKAMDLDIPDELFEAMKFCTTNEPEVIDEVRREFLENLEKWQEDLKEERERWYQECVAPEHKRLLSGINVPLIARLQKIYDIPDDGLVEDFTKGFPITGEMVNDCDGLRTEEWHQGCTKEEVLEHAQEYNKRMLARVRENEWSKDVNTQQWEDFQEGF